ncbi:TSUP family transporter [Saccharopolyspora sp. NFXS83]|uniref:TSUP family transporter n=1 Tax=Saccharopolyspora sp. NFXS83 TaxID=2993560 RepID=UPI00224B6FC5|nr:TSUP family transporter [Saccharopolyspora sp. NFXS83]MCX2731895.1 TSUP family transporter [Saccharopolyspora sp. NFXS83]
MSGGVFAALCVVVLVGALLQVSIGFGLGMLAAPVLALLAPELLPAVVVLLAAAVTGAVVLLEGEHLDVRGTAWALLGRVPGVAAGAVLVAALPARALALCVAAVVALGVLASWWGFTPHPTRRAVVVAGLASGLMATTTAIGGPPMAMVWQRLAGPRLRSTMSAYFLLGSIMTFTGLCLAGVVTTESLRYAVLLAPAAAAGVLLARPLAAHLDVGRTRNLAMLLSLAGAATLTAQQLT